MLKNVDYKTARDTLLQIVAPVDAEAVPLSQCGGRILASDLIAAENIPPFDRSPYDGYSFRAADVAEASQDHPVTLQILEVIPAGAVPTVTVIEGTAVKILTGAPIPPGADAVVPFERTEFTDSTVTIFASVKPGANIVRTGEDVKQGDVLAQGGDPIDAGTAGTLASQGIGQPVVYRIPRIGIVSTGSELVEADQVPGVGKIRNSNCHTLEAAIAAVGCEPVYLGLAGDSAEKICQWMKQGLENCDLVISTGGVSVGDYDLTPDAMEMAGARLLIQRLDIKPGMACAFGDCGGKLICALSGNPSSSLTTFYAVVLPVLKKLAGWRDPIPEEIDIMIPDGFGKKSLATRFLRGKLDLSGGTVKLIVPKEQGNVVLSSAIGCDAMAIVPAGSDKVEPGTILKGFVL